MVIPGARPCRSPKCPGIFVWLANRPPGAKSPWMPVDVSSLSKDDQGRIRSAGTSRELDYDRTRHVSHYKTCLDPSQFSAGKRKEPEKPEARRK